MRQLETERLLLRNWRENDLDVMHRLNSDAQVMRYFPIRRDRAESRKMLEDVRTRNDRQGFGWSAVVLKSTGQPIGFAGISEFNADVPFAPATEIGWRLLPEFWGQGYATEAARAWMNFGFEERGLTRIVSFAVPENTASIAVMRRLGMQRRSDLDFDHPKVSDTHPHLQRHIVYAMTCDDWASGR